MLPIQIPQSPIVTADGKVTNEWLVFLNELTRAITTLNNEKADKTP